MPTDAERLASLDVFRGLTIAGMVLVNNPGSFDHVYAPLRHAAWHGWTPTDLVFPFFLFIVGVALTFALPRQLEAAGRRRLYVGILRRSLVIFALGLLLNTWPEFDLADLRVAGVLQRIAVVYLLTAVLFVETSRRAQLWTLSGLLLGYWAAMLLLPVPGQGAGRLTPEGNLASWIDRAVLPGRVWNGVFDPEGLLTTLPSIATCLIGVFTGYWIRSGRPRAEIAAGMLTAGWGLILAGLAWDLVFPINKNLWTSSYVLFTGGAALEALGCCYWLIDVRGHRGWAQPAVVFGLNPIALYVGSTLLPPAMYRIKLPVAPEGTTVNSVLWDTLFSGWRNPMAASLVYALAYLGIWWLLMAWLYRKRIFLSA